MLMKSEETLVQVENLRMYFPVKGGVVRRKVADIKAVDGISFSIKKGETLGLVGESGSGKSTTARCILWLHKATGGKIFFMGKDLSKLGDAGMKSVRRDMQMIFEDPYYSLDPRMLVGDIIAEPMRIHKVADDEERKKRVAELLMMVHLEPNMAERYPHQFSAGQRQRIEIARALALRPSFVVCDNPVSELDVSIQAQIIALLEWFRGWLNLSYLFISHDLAVVRYLCDRCMVMYVGKIMESADTDELFSNPLHPYTKALLSAVLIPDPEAEHRRKLIILPGETPSSINPPVGCRFHPRCSIVMDICKEQPPELKNVGGEHYVACHRV
ncbi:MAG: ABC transporter ATP-binding protein [Chloroflexi bacterium]|nr:ABC transporter ATP-binding protein [Chloroflexota bacterium]